MKSELEIITGISAEEIGRFTNKEIDKFIESNGGPDIMGFVGKEGNDADK